jgi:DNA-binding MarR family transcriptional regulator
MQHTHNRVENLLGVLALTVADQMAAAMTETAAQGGGTPAALVQMADHPGLTIEELRCRIGLSHSTVVRLLDRLVARGLVQRERNQRDARTAGLRLTEEGHVLARSVLTARKEAIAAIVTRLTPNRQRDLESLLDEMLPDLAVTPGYASLMCRLCCLRECPADRCPVELRYQDLLKAR